MDRDANDLHCCIRRGHDHDDCSSEPARRIHSICTRSRRARAASLTFRIPPSLDSGSPSCPSAVRSDHTRYLLWLVATAAKDRLNIYATLIRFAALSDCRTIAIYEPRREVIPYSDRPGVFSSPRGPSE
jgi:hypothetical protein